MKKIILIFFLLITQNLCYSQDSMTTNSKTLEQIQNDIKKIRSDQLNYQIERDLLKETYSSNYSTIQIIITLILGVFGIIGFLGLKSIWGLKKEYDTELAKLRELKIDFEFKLKELVESQNKVKEQIKSIDDINNEQNQKINFLEIKEKVSSFCSQKNWQRALEYTDIGLEIKKDDVELLLRRADILFKLKKFPESIEAYNKILPVFLDNKVIINNVAELYLLAEKIDGYKNYIKDNIDIIKSNSEGLMTYLEALKNYIEGNHQNLSKIILDFTNKQEQLVAKNFLKDWELEEFNYFINQKPNSKEKTLLINFTSYLKGGMSTSQMKDLVNKKI